MQGKLEVTILVNLKILKTEIFICFKIEQFFMFQK